MATTKTLAPTNQTITIAGFQGEKPDQRQIADAEGKLADAVNALNSQIAAYYAPSGSSLKQLAFNNDVCPVGRVRWIIPRDCVTTDLPNANAVYSMARVNRRLANVVRLEIYYDNGETYFASSNDSGSTWSAWTLFTGYMQESPSNHSEDINTISAYRRGSIVQVNVEIKAGLSAGWHNTILSGLSTNFRPLAPVYGSRRVSASADLAKPTIAILNTDGTIQFLNNDVMNAVVTYSFTFVSSN